jgi:hypothetical protein
VIGVFLDIMFLGRLMNNVFYVLPIPIIISLLGNQNVISLKWTNVMKKDDILNDEKCFLFSSNRAESSSNLGREIKSGQKIILIILQGRSKNCETS